MVEMRLEHNEAEFMMELRTGASCDKFWNSKLATAKQTDVENEGDEGCQLSAR